MPDAVALDERLPHSLGRTWQRASVLHRLSGGPQTQSGMLDACDVSQPVMTRVIRGLVDDGLVRSIGKAESTGGRRPTLLALQAHSRAAAGIRLQRHRIEVLVVDLAGAEIHRATRRWSGAELACDDIVAAATDARAAVPPSTPLVGVKVAAPGVVDPHAGTVSQAPDLGWTDPTPLRSALAAGLGVPVVIDNDVNVMCAGEHGDGALAGSLNGAMLYVGDGIGAAVMVDGRPQPGTWGAGAEIGLIPVAARADSPRLEEVYSLPAIAARMGLDGREVASAASSLFDAAANGDRRAQVLAREVIDGWAYAVTILALIVDPDRIALAGALCAMHDEHFEALRRQVADRIPSPMVLRRALLGEDAVLRGAAGAALRDAIDQGLWPSSVTDSRPGRRRTRA